MNWLKIQNRLKLLGFNPGPLDGIFGRRTIAAIKAFQKSERIRVDGLIGPVTLSRLFEGRNASDSDIALDKDLESTIPWYDEAERLQGTAEVAGSGSNPIILDWADDLDLHYKDDDIPWCGLFVAHCIGATLPDEVLPTNVLGARNWLHFGKQIGPRLGAVLVFWRGTRQGWRGHVGFYSGEDSINYYVLGGNQSNMVNIAKISKNRLLGARWPITALRGEGAGKVAMSLSGRRSTNEE